MQRDISREGRIYAEALRILEIMRSNPNRLEAIDAYDMARILFRKTADSSFSAQGQSEDREVFSQSS